MEDIGKIKNRLRQLIPRTMKGDPKTDRLEQLDTIIMSRKLGLSDLDFIEKEILSAVEFFKDRKKS
jgi:hypothetical protein